MNIFMLKDLLFFMSLSRGRNNRYSESVEDYIIIYLLMLIQFACILHLQYIKRKFLVPIKIIDSHEIAVV